MLFLCPSFVPFLRSPLFLDCLSYRIDSVWCFPQEAHNYYYRVRFGDSARYAAVCASMQSRQGTPLFNSQWAIFLVRPIFPSPSSRSPMGLQGSQTPLLELGWHLADQLILNNTWVFRILCLNLRGGVAGAVGVRGKEEKVGCSVPGTPGAKESRPRGDVRTCEQSPHCEDCGQAGSANYGSPCL